MKLVKRKFKKGKFWYLLNDFRNFNEIFRNVVTLKILKVTKKQGFTLSLENMFLEKSQVGVKLPHLAL